MSDGWEWRQQWEITPEDAVSQEPEYTTLGWDIKFPSDTDPVIIEYHTTDNYTTTGFAEAFRHGCINDIRWAYHDKPNAAFTQFLADHEQKDAAHDILDAFLPALVEDVQEVETEKVVAKKPGSGGGRDVTVLDTADLQYGLVTIPESWIVEEFVSTDGVPVYETGPKQLGRAVPPLMETRIGAGISMLSVLPLLGFSYVNGEITSPMEDAAQLGVLTGAALCLDGGCRDYWNGLSTLAGEVYDSVRETVMGEVEPTVFDGCMRYVTGVEVADDRVIVEDLGGYMRTASAPMDSDAAVNERFIANLDGGPAVPASDEDLQAASETVVDATTQLYEQWLNREGYTDPDITVTPV